LVNAPPKPSRSHCDFGLANFFRKSSLRVASTPQARPSETPPEFHFGRRLSVVN
jgi:hypothetical protein